LRWKPSPWFSKAHPAAPSKRAKFSSAGFPSPTTNHGKHQWPRVGRLAGIWQALVLRLLARWWHSPNHKRHAERLTARHDAKPAMNQSNPDIAPNSTMLPLQRLNHEPPRLVLPLQGAHGLLGSERERPASAARFAVRRLGGLLTGQPPAVKNLGSVRGSLRNPPPPRKGRD
jgi:hypothetical protein